MTIARCIRRCINAVGAVVGAIVPFDLDQLLLDTAQGDPYYSDSEDPSGAFTHMLADRSKQAGDLREKRLGHCLEFNGVDQAADLGVAYTNETKIAFAGWFKIPEGQTAGDVFFGNDTNTTGTRGWAMRSYGGQVLELFISPDGNVTDYYRFRYTDIADGTWHHIAFIFDAGTVSFYLDGSLTAAAVTAHVGSPAGTINANGQNTFVGAKSGPATYGELTCYDIRQAEGAAADDLIAELATIISTPVTTTTSLLSHHWMQEESGSTVYDSSGNGNHGTISGYAASQRVTDAGVQYSVANEVGVSPRMLFDGVDDYVVIDSPVHTTATYRLQFRVFLSKTPGGDVRIIGPDQYSSTAWGYRLGQVTYRIASVKAVGFDLAAGQEVLVDSIADGATATTTFSRSDGNSTTVTHSVNPGGFSISHIGGNYLYTFPGLIYGIKLDIGNTGTWEYEWNGSKEVYGKISAVYGDPSESHLPPLDSSTTQDALGGELTYKGRCPMYGLAKHVAWQGNGTDVWVECSEPGLPASADWTCSLRYYHVTNNTTVRNVLSQTAASAASTNRVVLSANGNGAGVLRLYIHDTSSPIAIDVSALNAGEWHKIDMERSGDVFTVTVTNEDGTEAVGTQTETSITIAAEDLGFMQYHSGLPQYNDGRLGPVTITTGGVTTTYVPIEGTRDVAKITSDGSANDYIVSAVTGGSLATLYTQNDGSYRLAHIENGANYSNENRLTKSEQLTVSPWSRSFLTFDEVGTLGIAKTFRANAAVGSSTSPFLLQAFTTTNVQKYVYSVCAKAGTLRYLQIMDGGGFASVGVNFDLQLGVYKETSDTLVSGVYDMVDLGDGWYRCILEMPANATATTSSIYWRLIDDYDATRAQAGRWLSGDHLFVSQHQVFEGLIADLPGYSITGDDPITEARLVPCDPLGGTPDGTPRNILPGKLDRQQGIRVDRTGGKLSPLDYELGLDELTNEHGEQWVENITGDW